jgi:polysaccharide biosynthesis/export protein
MKKQIYILIGSLISCFILGSANSGYANLPKYTVGVDDVLKINILQPEQFETEVTVSPDGSITFPYIDMLFVKGMSLPEIQSQIREKLADGYMNYPVVLVSLKESRSRKFFVYGEVIKPGSYSIQNNTTILQAISMAGGFTKFGASGRIKVLRPKDETEGYSTIKINFNALIKGEPEADIIIKPGDMVVVSAGVF